MVKPGEGADSLLVRILRHPNPDRRMPRDADPLPDETVALLRAWIDAGAKEGTRPAETEVASAPSTPGRRRTINVVLPTKLQKPPQFAFSAPIGPLPPVAAVAFSPDGSRLAVGTYGRVTLWDVKTVQPVRTITNVLGAVNDLKFGPNGSTLAVAGGQPSARGDLRIFDIASGNLIATLGGHLDVVACVSFNPDGRTLASASYDKTVRVWDVATGKVKQTLTGHSDFVYSVAFGPGGEWLATASKDRTVRITDPATGQSRLTFSGMDQDVLAVAVRPDGRAVVSSGYEAGLYWWDAKTGERTKRQNGHDVAVHELAFDPTGKFLASAGADRTVRLWDGTSGEPVRTLPTGTVTYAVALTATRVAAGGADGLVRVWDAATGRLLVTLLATGDDWLALTPEGYAAGSDRLLKTGRWTSAGSPLDPGAGLVRPDLVAKALAGDKLSEPTVPTPRKN